MILHVFITCLLNYLEQLSSYMYEQGLLVNPMRPGNSITL